MVTEATPGYWRPVVYVLEAAGLATWLVDAKDATWLVDAKDATWLVDAKDVEHLPGRSKTNKLDAVWLCKVAGGQTIRPSFVPRRRSAAA